ncbi:MAG: PP2C family protein-serine/threonine phosphatase, partial [Actinomycetota bacterium]
GSVADDDLAREPIPGGVLVARPHPAPEPIARVLRDGDLDHVSTIVALAAVAYARAFSFETEVATSAALRRAILPDEVPEIDGWEIDVHHEAVDDSERIGGDFYDALRIGDDLVVVLGDVVGHGLEATHQMSTVRGMLRTVTSSLGADPAGILAQANEIFERVCGRGAPFATVLLAAIQLPTGRVRVASAGHVAPILRRISGIERLTIRPGPPLGVVPHTTYPVADVAIDHGDWIAVFTDGVFERRAEIIDETIDRVLSQLDPSASASQIVGLAEVTSLEARPTDDDRAMVLVRRSGSSFSPHAETAAEGARGAVTTGGS